MKNILYIFLISCFSFTIISCAKKSGGSSGSSSSDANESGGGSSNSACNNSKAFIVGTAQTEKCSSTDCPERKIVIWDVCGGGTSVMGEAGFWGVADAASHNNLIYIAVQSDKAGFYWIVGADNKIEKHQLNNQDILNEVTGIAVNSIGDVYVAGIVIKDKKYLNAYWKNGELVKTFTEKNDGGPAEYHIAADSKGNVYVPGWRMKSHSVTNASYWKNGVRKDLTSTYDGETTDVVVSGTKVYFSGNHGKYCDIPCPIKGGIVAAYWQLGKGMTKVIKAKTSGIKAKWLMRSSASSIHVEGSTVYMAGTIEGDIPVYWKNKRHRELQVECELDNAGLIDWWTCIAPEPIDIKLLDGHVLVAGNYTSPSFKAVYWLDKKLYKLCESCFESYAVALVVID